MALLAVNHLTPVVGIDVHQVTGPPFPIMPHPHVGFVFDVQEYIAAFEAMIGSIVFSFIEEQVSDFVASHEAQIAEVMNSGVVKSAMGTVAAVNDAVDKVMDNDVVKTVANLQNSINDALGGNVGRGGGGAPIWINGFMRATAGTHNYHIPGLHFPLGGTFTGADAKGPSQDSESFMGSKTVLANGDPLSFLALPALSCWFVGMVPMDHNSAHTDRKSMSLPTAVMLPIPAGRPVLVGGPPIMNMMAFAAGLFKAFRGSKLAKKLFEKFPSGFIKCVIFDAEPVNSVTGEVVVQQNDFTIEGRLPLVWDRYYASHDPHAGALGHGWQSPADVRLELVRDDTGNQAQFGAAVYFPDHFTAFDMLPDQPGWDARRYDRQHGHAVYIEGDALTVRTRGGLEYAFALPVHWREQVPAKRSGRRMHLPLTQLSDLNGNAWRVERSEQAGAVLRFVEHSAGRPTSRALHAGAGDVRGCLGELTLVDARGQRHPLVRYEQNRTGDLIAVHDALKAPYTFEYRGEHLMVRHTDRNGLSFYYSHQQHADGLWRVDHAWGDGGLYDYRFEYDLTYLETRIVDSLGGVSVLQYDAQQLPVSRTDQLGGVRSYRYDGAGRTIAETDPAGYTTSWEYDEHANLIEQRLPDDTAVRTQYDADHRPVAISDPEGGVWQQKWDARGNLIAQITPSGTASQFAYDSQGQLVQVTDAAQQVTTLAYDPLGYLAELTDPVGRATRFRHDARGNLLRRESPGEEATTYTWDPKGRLVACALPGERFVRCEYDAEDNLTRYTDEAGHVTTFGYYGQGQLASRTDADGSVTRYHYDTEEQLTGVTNPLGQTWKLRRDAAGRLVEEVGYDGQSRRYAYNRAGHLTQTMDPLGHALAITCDPLGRITSRIAGEAQEHYRYNGRGQLTEARNAQSVVERSYDDDGRLVRETQQQDEATAVLEYVYDAAGRLQLHDRTLRLATGDTRFAQALKYEYDALGQPQSVQMDDHEPIRFTRDLAGRLSDTRFNSDFGHQYRYDRAGRLREHATKRAGHRDEITGYDYDASGNLTVRRDSRLGEDRYRYDPLGRIIAHTDPAGRLRHFAYDAHGDRFRTHERADGARELHHADGAKWRLDAAGQLVVRQDAEHGVQRFEWDAFGRLACFENTRNECWRYRYDALGRRIAKMAAEVRYTGREHAHSQRGAQTWFLWDGDALAGEARARDATSGAVDEARFYAYHLDSFEPLTMQVAAAADDAADSRLYYYQNDVNGAPMRLRDGAGAVVWEAHYGVTGRVDRIEVGAVEQGLRLQGQYFDPESNLHYNRHRYFDPGTGLFVSQDPIGLAGGENPYQLGPNILDWIDPLGLWKKHKNNGQFAKKPGRKRKKCPSKHGNSLDTDKPTQGYTLRDRDNGSVAKYGETTNGKKRYSQEYLDANNVDMIFEEKGSKREMHTWQHEMILEHTRIHGARPRLNKSDY
ncbi:DUF6531 domain-containing protein [Caballeronia sp. LZ019]|uniref:DUF6531 domain-containing protein n=1 Tax=Caballeronia sp. LZ019 TaxID=3038555 RepID=UPI0028668642|nr:DUF6531 domain-containing protein [Caballeronia sp. LZ019]MDR5806745.1 RHS repeat-associated core domain-containing protein [Caballeronia sp. LZ019]